MRRLLAIWFCAACVTFGGQSANAQTFRVTAGEHPEFSRIVVQMPPETQWSFTSESRQHRLEISPPTGEFDISRLFDRIPRTRLSSAETSPGRLDMNAACDCGIRAWQERPGLVVIDFRDNEPTEVATPVPSPQRTGAPQPLETARVAGAALAQAHAIEQLRLAQASSDNTAPSVDTITRSLGLPIARALSQGLLEPTRVEGRDPSVLLPSVTDVPGDLPDNMRITSVTDGTATRPEDDRATACQGAEALDFLLDPPTEPFDVEFGRLTRALYGEFDQPDPDARLGMIELYLASGFGAEARALIANEPAPVVGRDLLLGLSDVLEDRNSNSRMRLAQMIGCAGPASVVAVLAGAQAGEILDASPEIALNFTELGAPLRAILSPALITRLVDAQAVDAARIIAGSAGRSPWMDPNAANVIDAQLDHARGFPADAVARLDHAQTADSASVLTRLRLSLETGIETPPEALANAESLASTERGDQTGADIMSAVIRLYARSGDFPRAFAALDRLRSWVPQYRRDDPMHDALRDAVWAAMAQVGDDLDLMRSVLGREDWRSPQLTLGTRQSLALRLLELGLGRQVLSLLADAHDTLSTEIMARAYVDQAEPERAVEVLTGLETTDARRTRAQALATLGQAEAAVQEFDALSDTQEARRTAISARDWERVEQVPEATDALYDVGRIGQVMRYAPGHLETALQSTATGTSSQETPTNTAAPVGVTAPEAVSGASASGQQSPEAPAATEPVSFDRLGLITRSATLLDESARLRDILAPLTVTEMPDTAQP